LQGTPFPSKASHWKQQDPGRTLDASGPEGRASQPNQFPHEREGGEPLLPLPGIEGEQSAPTVAGTPHISGSPMVQGTPPIVHPPPFGAGLAQNAASPAPPPALSSFPQHPVIEPQLPYRAGVEPRSPHQPATGPHPPHGPLSPTSVPVRSMPPPYGPPPHPPSPRRVPVSRWQEYLAIAIVSIVILVSSISV